MHSDITLADLTDTQLQIFTDTAYCLVLDVKEGSMSISDLAEKQEYFIDTYINVNELPSNARHLFNEWKESVDYYGKLAAWLDGVETVAPEQVTRPEVTPEKEDTQKEDNKNTVPQYLKDVLNEYNLTIKDLEKFETIKNSTYQLRKNYTRQEVINLFIVQSTKLCERPLTDSEIESMPHEAAGYWNTWRPDDVDEFYASGEKSIIEAEYHTLINQGMSLEDTAKALIKKYPYCPPHTMDAILKDGEAFLPFDVGDFYH